MIILNHHPKVLNHNKFIFFCHCDTSLGSLTIVHERCKSSCFILPFSIDWSQNLRVFVSWNACLLAYMSCFGQDINRLPCFYCFLFFIDLFRICLTIQEKLLAWSLFANHFDFPGSDSRDVTMGKIMVRAIPIGSITKFASPPRCDCETTSGEAASREERGRKPEESKNNDCNAFIHKSWTPALWRRSVFVGRLE